MTTADYIDWDEGRNFEDASSSVAVLQCENCRHTCERLTHVPEWDYMGCDDCVEEAFAVLAREACEHVHVRVESFDDVNEDRVTCYESITCRDCGEDLIDRKGELVARNRRAA